MPWPQPHRSKWRLQRDRQWLRVSSEGWRGDGVPVRRSSEGTRAEELLVSDTDTDLVDSSVPHPQRLEFSSPPQPRPRPSLSLVTTRRKNLHLVPPTPHYTLVYPLIPTGVPTHVPTSVPRNREGTP